MTSKRARLIALFAIGTILAGCTGGGSSAAPSSAPPAATPQASASGPAATPDGTLPTPELTSIKIGISAPTTPNRGQLAHMLGFFQKYGLTAEVIGFEGDARTLQAITAGQIDFGIGAAANVISSQLTDSPLAIVSVGNLVNRDALWCQPDIKVAADVRGKSIGISTFGGTSHASALGALKLLGLTSSDVTITQVGAEAARVAALSGGSVGCVVAIADYPGEVMAKMNAVIKMGDAGLLIAASTTFASKEFLAKNPNTALVAVAAMLEAHNSIFADPDTAAEKWVEFAQVTPEDADQFVQDVINNYNRSLVWTDEALENPKETLATIRPEVASVDLAACSDHSLLQKLKDIGFNNKIGLPTS